MNIGDKNINAINTEDVMSHFVEEVIDVYELSEKEEGVEIEIKNIINVLSK
jgi:hypothetical protein